MHTSEETESLMCITITTADRLTTDMQEMRWEHSIQNEGFL